MTNKDFKEGMEVTCDFNGVTMKDNLELHFDEGLWFVVKLDDDKKDWHWRTNVNNVTNLQPKHRTIDDLECGDYVVDYFHNKRKCLGKCGEVYFMSSINCSEKFDIIWTIQRIKDNGYTLYQPTEEKEEVKETDIDKCIKVVEEYFEDNCSLTKRALIEKLKNLKK